jgi:DNA-binding NarL/FixJ family response regulator
MSRPSRPSGLTESELRLLPLLATPLSFEEIARLLEVQRDDVQVEAIAIYEKLGLRDGNGRSEL